MKPKKVKGGKEFDSLMGALAHVPKSEVDRKARAWKKARAKRAKKPKQ